MIEADIAIIGVYIVYKESEALFWFSNLGKNYGLYTNPNYII